MVHLARLNHATAPLTASAVGLAYSAVVLTLTISAHLSSNAKNLSMRMGMRRFTRLTNGFSKTFENHAHQVALYFMHYNFCRVHNTLRVTPAMEAGLTDHVRTLEELCSLLPEKKPNARVEKEMVLKALQKA